MSLKVADRVKENTTTVGSGILNLVGNTDGFQRFTNVLASGDITYYCIEENNKFEVGIGTYVADTLTRDYILRSSSNGNKINLQGSGVVFITYPADKAVYKNQESQVIIGPSGLIFNDNSIQLTAAKSIDEFNYISGITVNNQSDIVYLSGIAVNAEETLDINYVSGIATYASGQAINNKASITTNSNDIVYLSGLVVAAEESDSISYVSGVANYSSGQSIQNQQQILATSGWAANTFSTINNVNYISGVAIYSSGKSIQNTNDIIYLSGLVINAEESNDLSYVSGIAVYTSGKIYNDTYLSGISVYSSGQSIENEIQINAVSGWANSSFLRENSNSFIYLSGLVVAAEESNDIAYVSGVSVYGSGLGLSNASNIVAISGIASYASGQAIYNTNSIANLATEINYVSGLAILAEESLDISYVSGVAAYASGKTISNTNDIVYLSGLVVAAEETSAINYVSGIATYSSGQSIANQASIGNLTSNLAYVSGLAVLAEESIDVTYISGIAVYASGKIYNDTYVSGIAVYASGRSIANEVSINNINMDIVYLSGIATNAEETLDINYISGIAVYTSGKIYNDTYLSGIATYASGQTISNQSQINAVSGWADASFLRENSSPFVYLSGLVVAAEESTDINYISGITIYSSGQSINNQQQITSVSGWATNTFATNNNLVYVSGISNYASGQSLTNQSNITSLNNDLVYISGLAVLAEESLDINYVSGIAVYSSGKAINNENTIFATSGWANSTFATNIDLQYVSGIAVYVSGNALYNVVEDTSPQLGGNLDTNNYYISGVGNIIGGTGLFSSLKINNIDVSVSGHTHIASDITNFNTAVSGLIPVKNIVAGTNISVTNVSGVYTINDISTSTTSAASIVTTVFNKTGAAMPKMTAVYLNGGQGDLPTIQKALAISDATSAATYGLTYETIDNMSTGRVIVLGALTGLNTDQFNPNSPHGNINGSILYLSPTISGALTTTKPYSPQHIVAIGTVVRTHQNEGVIEVRIQNGFELEELHNVAISGVTNGAFLQYNASSGLWLPSNSGYFNNLYLGANGLYFNDGTQQTTSGLPYGSGSLINRNTADIIYISGLVVAAEETTQINYVSGIAVYSSGLSVQNQSNIVAVSGLVPTISNSSDNRVLTSTGAGTGINAESNLTFDGTNLGIGTSSPAEKLHVEQSSGISTIVIRSTASVASRINFRTTNDNNGFINYDTGEWKIFNDSSGTATERIRITSAGNVGIGSTSPTTLLHILGTGEGIHSGRVGGPRPHLRLQHANGTVASRTISASGNYVGQVSFEGYNGTSYMEHTGIFGIVNGTVTTSSIPTDLVFSAGSSGNTASNEKMRITSAGNVGIGSISNNINIRTRLQVCGPDATDTPSLGTATGAFLITNTDSLYGTQFGVSSDGFGWIQQGRVDGTATAYNLLLNPVGGNVGIGTSSPSTKLQINGQTRVTDGTTNIDFVSSSAVGYIGTQTNHPLVLRTNDTERMRITSAGNVGIGTFSSIDTGYKLHVSGSIRSDASSTSAPSIIGIKDFTNQSTGDNISSATYSYITSAGNYAIRNLAVNTYHKINSGVTNNDASIGIVNNTLRNYALTNDAGSLWLLYGIHNQFGHYNTSAVSPSTTVAYGYYSSLNRYTGSIAEAYDFFCIDSGTATVSTRYGMYIYHTGMNYFAGKVGIGTGATNPPELLSVMQDNNGSRTSILIDNLDQRLKMSCWYEAGLYQFSDIQSSNNAETGYTALTLNRLGGSVGVGVIPNHRFDVRGSGATSATISFHVANSTPSSLFYLRNDGGIFTGLLAVSPYNLVTGVAANMVVGSDGFLYRSTSSSRYKTQINDATHGLNEVLKLRSVTYKSQNDGNKIFGGLIAEEVDSAGLTEFVQYDSENRPDAIHYSNMVALLVKAIQEQQTQINELKNRLSALEGA